MFAFISEVQLALDSLDRLVETLEERGPLSASDAARALFATSSISDGLACSLLEEVTAGDSRIVCAGATVSLAGTQTRPAARGGRARRLRPRNHRPLGGARPHLRARRGSRTGARAGRLVSVAREPEGRAPRPRCPPHRVARPGVARRAFDLDGARPLPHVRGRFAPRGAQRALRPALPRTPALGHARSAPLRASALHRRACSAPPRGTRAPRQPCVARPLLRCSDEPVPPGPSGCRSHGPGACAPDRARPGDRRAPPLRSARTGCSSQTSRLRQALVGSKRADPARRVPLPGPARAGAVRRSCPRSASASRLLFPERSPTAVGRGSAARARTHRVARPGLRARGRPRRAAADPRAGAAGECAQPQEATRPLPEAPG